MNWIKAVGLFIGKTFKEAFVWGIKIDNLKKIKTQLDILNAGSKYFGQSTNFKYFSDVADVTISMAKTIDSILDGQEDEKQKEFIETINKNEKELKGLSVKLNEESGISVSYNEIHGIYNPKTGRVKLEERKR